MSSHQKLQLTKQDLKYVYNQILNDILQKLDLHLPTSNNDSMKNKVANNLHDHLNEVFEMAKNAMVVDGQDMGGKSGSSISDLLSLKPKEKTEPFDFELNAQLRELLQDVEHETIEVTNLRKSVPNEFNQRYSSVITEVDEGVSKFLSGLEKGDGDEEVNSSVIDTSNDKMDEMMQEYEEHLLQLNELKNKLPKQLSEIDMVSELTSFLERRHEEV